MTDFRTEPRASQPAPDAVSAQEALARMAEEIRYLDEAAERAAGRVSAAADDLRHGDGGDFQSQLMADLGASLVGRVDAIHAECQRLAGMLARAAKLSAPAAPAAPAPRERDVPEIFKPAIANGSAEPEPLLREAARPAERQPEPAPEPERRPAPRLDRRRAPGRSTPEGVRLAATQMAVAGSSRSEIERCLRIQFGVSDADAALDEIFGTRSSEVR